MSKTIRDLFTKEEWELFGLKTVIQLQQIADLELPEQFEAELPKQPELEVSENDA